MRQQTPFTCEYRPLSHYAKGLCAVVLLGCLALISCKGAVAPTTNLCTPATGGFAQHPDWLAWLDAQKGQEAGTFACLQMSWTDDTQFQGASTTFIRVNQSGEMRANEPRNGEVSPFVSLVMPETPQAYRYRFRVFVFPEGVREPAAFCKGEMSKPSFSCLNATGTCKFYHEIRFAADAFTGNTTPIEGDPTLLCKTYLRSPPEIVAEPTPEPGLEPRTEPLDAAADSTPDMPPEQDQAPPCKPTGKELCGNDIDDDCDGKIDNTPGCVWLAGSYQLNAADAIHDIAVATDGSVYIVGSFLSLELRLGTSQQKRKGAEGMFLAKLSAQGEWVWFETYGGEKPASRIIGYSIVVDANQSLYVTGYHVHSVQLGKLTMEGANEKPRMFVARRNADGTWAWTNGVVSADGSWGGNIALDKNGRVYLAGLTTSPFSLGPLLFNAKGSKRIFFGRLTTGGQWEWASQIRQHAQVLPFARSQLPLVTVGSNHVFVLSYFVGTTSILEKTITGGAKKTAFVVRHIIRGFPRSFHVIGASKDIVPQAISFSDEKASDETKVNQVGVSGIIKAGQRVDFSPTLRLVTGKEDAGFFAIMNNEGEWRKATLLTGPSDSTKPLEQIKVTALANNNKGEWYVGGDFRGTLQIGSHTATSDRNGAYFLSVYDDYKEQWKRLYQARSTGTFQVATGLTTPLKAHRAPNQALFLIGGNLPGNFGPHLSKRRFSMFLGKSLQLEP